MLTICTRWDEVQLPAETEWRMWRQLRGAFGIDAFNATPVVPDMTGVNIGQFPTMQECLDASAGRRVFFEPDGPHSFTDIPAGGDLVLVFGNTLEGNKTLIRPEDLSVQIPSARPVDLYGVSAAAIALHEIFVS